MLHEYNIHLSLYVIITTRQQVFEIVPPAFSSLPSDDYYFHRNGGTIVNWNEPKRMSEAMPPLRHSLRSCTDVDVTIHFQFRGPRKVIEENSNPMCRSGIKSSTYLFTISVVSQMFQYEWCDGILRSSRWVKLTLVCKMNNHMITESRN